jgi:hypothetical protein
MRRGFGLIGLLFTVILLAVVGTIAYNVGWSDGVATHLPSGTAVAPPYYYGYGPHFWGAGVGIFGFFWVLFILFILFGLLRFAFFGRRYWGGGWGSGRGIGYGHHGMPPAMNDRMQEWHKQAHGEQPSGATPPPPPPPDQRSV